MTITIELTEAEARAWLHTAPAGVESNILRNSTCDRIRAALSRSELGLPWEAKNGGGYWGITGGNGQTLISNCNGPQARLMAAAPELADALEGVIQLAEAENWDHTDLITQARAALAKAGR